MNKLAALIALLTSTCAWAEDAKPNPLAGLHWLQGQWVGIGEGEPGRSAAQRSIECMLDCRYLRSEGRSVYPKQEKNKDGEIHEAMDIWSFDRKRKKLVLRTFDNLGFVTTYVQQDGAAPDTLVLVAEHLENVPSGWKARYTYTFAAPDEYREQFELDPDGKGYQPYTSNRFLRVGEGNP
jgi:hypothetical protein